MCDGNFLLGSHVKDPHAQPWAFGLIKTQDYKELNDTARNKTRQISNFRPPSWVTLGDVPKRKSATTLESACFSQALQTLLQGLSKNEKNKAFFMRTEETKDM